ncbi:MAG: hypothetical protein QXS37_05705 [Candidatus Aenigmatarchaeota archaeon]
MKHSERCKKCKAIIKSMLEKIFGKVEPNFQFDITPSLNEFKNTQYYEDLKNIFTKLQTYRGFRDFVRTKLLPKCDFFISNPGFIVEFDETQHFTIPRRITLESYPSNLKLGFDKEKWIGLCDSLKRKDNSPPFRDEQRAWYDSIRDFLPVLKNLQPTVRLFSKDFIWCSLNPNNEEDVKKFEKILKGENK